MGPSGPVFFLVGEVRGLGIEVRANANGVPSERAK
jgi:hypothetical protein